MQIVASGNNLHEISKPVFSENKKSIINLSSAKFAQRVVKINFLTFNMLLEKAVNDK